MPQFSVVIPVYNEESNLEELHRRLDSVFKEIGSNMELIFCDDGSHDGTPQIIAELHEKDPRVKCLRLSRNFGQQAALLCGLHHASGEAVILMDADLQDPPETIPSMVEKMREGFDVVTCVRASRPEAFIKRMAYNIFYKLLSSISYFPIAPHVGDFSIMRRNVVNAITDNCGLSIIPL